MTSRHFLEAVAAIFVLLIASTGVLNAQVSQTELADMLLTGSPVERARALEAAEAIAPARVSPQLHSALIMSLQRTNGILIEAHRSGRPVSTFEDPEYISKVQRVVADLRDPETIADLARATYSPAAVLAALVSFGHRSVPALVAEVSNLAAEQSVVEHSLRALRYIVQDIGVGRIDREMLSDIRRVTHQRLHGEQSLPSLLNAIDLAIVLEDPDLRAIVEKLATDPDEVAVRVGVASGNGSAVVDRMREHAAERLAGIPPSPPCCPRGT